jgi:FkbM family methyltransferase
MWYLSDRLISTLRVFHLYRPLQSLSNMRFKKRRLRFYSSFIKKGDLCFDIGANIGNRTDIFLKLGARVVAVEPQRECVQILNKKYKHNSQVTVLHAGLDERQGTKLIRICRNDAMSSMSEEWISAVKSGRFRDHNWHRTEEVHVYTLDSLISKYGLPCFCKIDVEGYELHVIKGLSVPIPCLQFEMSPEIFRSAIMCIEHLSGIGPYICTIIILANR